MNESCLSCYLEQEYQKARKKYAETNGKFWLGKTEAFYQTLVLLEDIASKKNQQEEQKTDEK